MDTQQPVEPTASVQSVAPMVPRGLLMTAQNIALWLLGNVLWAAVVACIAFQLQQHDFNPVVLLSALIGTSLGIGGAAIARNCGVRSLRLVVTGAVVLGIFGVVGPGHSDYF